MVSFSIHSIRCTLCSLDSGKLFCYGFFDAAKTKRPKQYIEPKCISEHLVTRIAKCGRTFVVFVTGG